VLEKRDWPPEAEFASPPSVLTYIRHLAAGDVKGEIKEMCTTCFILFSRKIFA